MGVAASPERSKGVVWGMVGRMPSGSTERVGAGALDFHRPALSPKVANC